MAVRSKDEIIAQLSARLGEDNSDEALALIEDVTDTLDDLSSVGDDGKDWKAEAERIDKEWREKYKARFTSGSEKDDTNLGSKGEPPKVITFDDLFKEKEG